MNPRILLVIAALLALAPARAAVAQAQPDTAGLARAVATVLADSLIPRISDRSPVYLMEVDAAFDFAVRALLKSAPGVNPAPRPSRFGEWVGTRGFTMRGDTAAVLVEFGTAQPTRGPIDTYIEHNEYLFVPGPSGWRFVRREFVRGMDLGGVRG